MRTINRILTIAILLSSSLAWAGTGVMTDAAGPFGGGESSPIYDFTTEIVLQDEFASGGTSNLTIGVLGWAMGGGTATSQASEANEIGIVRRDTSTSSGTVAYTSLATTGGLVQSAGTNTDLLWRLRVNNNDNDTIVRIGAFAAINGVPPGDGNFFEDGGADTNWQCVTRVGAATQTKTDSGVAVETTSFHKFRYIRTGTTDVKFYIDGVLVCTHTTNLTSTTISPTVYIRNGAAASKTLDIGYFELTYTGITR